MMNMVEVTERLCEMYHEEEHDAEVYDEMAEAAEKTEDWKLARGLRMIAHDEDTHKEFLRHYLMDHGLLKE